MKPSDCYAKIKEWESYDIGGSHYGTGNYVSYIAKLKKEYKDSGCGVDAVLEECFWYKERIEQLKVSIDETSQNGDSIREEFFRNSLKQYENKFNNLKCQNKLNEIKTKELTDTTKKYQDLDKIRIEALSNYERNKKIFIGATILFVALGVVVYFTNKKD